MERHDALTKITTKGSIPTEASQRCAATSAQEGAKSSVAAWGDSSPAWPGAATGFPVRGCISGTKGPIQVTRVQANHIAKWTGGTASEDAGSEDVT